jgi:hypothetical protein
LNRACPAARRSIASAATSAGAGTCFRIVRLAAAISIPHSWNRRFITRKQLPHGQIGQTQGTFGSSRRHVLGVM